MGKLAEAKMAPERVDQRNLVALLLDISESMGRDRLVPTPDGGSRNSKPIDELNRALRTFLAEDLPAHRKLQQSGEIAVAQFRGVGNDPAKYVDWLRLSSSDPECSHPFYFARDLEPQDELKAMGQTPIATAIIEGLKKIDERKEQLRRSKPPKSHEHRPVLYLVTDGEPEGESDRRLEEAIEDLQTAERKKKILFFSIATGAAKVDFLHRLSVGGSDNAYDLREHSLSALLQFVSRSSEATYSVDADGTSPVISDDPMDPRNTYIELRRKFNEGFFGNLDRPFGS